MNILSVSRILNVSKLVCIIMILSHRQIIIRWRPFDIKGFDSDTYILQLRNCFYTQALWKGEIYRTLHWHPFCPLYHIPLRGPPLRISFLLEFPSKAPSFLSKEMRKHAHFLYSTPKWPISSKQPQSILWY